MNDLAALSQAEWSVLYTDAFFLIALHFEFYLKSTYTFYLEKFLMDSENNEQGTKNASILPPRWKWKRGKMPKILTSVLHNMHQSQGRSTLVISAMTHDPRAGCWSESVLFQKCSEPEQCRRWNQFSVWDRWAIDTAHPSSQQYWKLFRSALFWILTKNNQGCGKCLFCMEPRSKCQCSEEDKVFILYLACEVSTLSHSHQQFCYGQQMDWIFSW